MPKLDYFGEEAVSDTIRFAPYSDWAEMPQVKAPDGDLKNRYSDDIIHIGYIAKKPTADRVRKLTRLAEAADSKKANNFSESWAKFCRYIVNDLITDWYDHDKGEDENTGDGTPWSEAQVKHLELFIRDEFLAGRFMAEYLDRYSHIEKKTDEELEDS